MARSVPVGTYQMLIKDRRSRATHLTQRINGRNKVVNACCRTRTLQYSHLMSAQLAEERRLSVGVTRPVACGISRISPIPLGLCIHQAQSSLASMNRVHGGRGELSQVANIEYSPPELSAAPKRELIVDCIRHVKRLPMPKACVNYRPHEQL
jgi:hypothetical protein